MKKDGKWGGGGQRKNGWGKIKERNVPSIKFYYFVSF